MLKLKTKKTCKHDMLLTDVRLRKCVINVENGGTLNYVPDCYKIKKCVIKQLITTLMLQNLFLNAMKLIPDWFDTNKMIKKLFTVYADENILYFDENSGNVVFNCNGMGIINIELNNINIDNNFDENDPGTIILIKL